MRRDTDDGVGSALRRERNWWSVMLCILLLGEGLVVERAWDFLLGWQVEGLLTHDDIGRLDGQI